MSIFLTKKVSILKLRALGLGIVLTPAALHAGLPLAYYPLDQSSGSTLQDVIAGNNLAIKGAEDWRPGQGIIGGAFSFGATSASSTSCCAWHDLSGDNYYVNYFPYTLACWVKTSRPETWSSTLFYIGNSNGNCYSALAYSNGYAGISVYNIYNGVKYSHTYTDTATKVNDGNWHYVVGEFFNWTKRALWVDGQLVGANSGSLRRVTSWPNRIGLGGLTQPIISGAYGGLVDDAAVWGTALTPQKVAVLYAMGVFEHLSATNSTIDALVGVYNSKSGYAQAGNDVWGYTNGLSGAVGSVGGSTANQNAYVVLDKSGNGLTIVGGAVGVPPTVTAVPRSQTNYVNSTVTLSVTAVSSQPINYAWSCNGNALPGQNGPTLALSNFNAPGSYLVKLINGLGTTSASATLSLAPLPTLVVSNILPDGSFQLTGHGIPDTVFEVDACSNVSGPWTKLTNITASDSGLAAFRDPSPVAANRFYRMTTPGGQQITAPANIIETSNWWYDINGNIITNQSDSILKVGNTFYWYGYDDQQTFDITCYTSTNLTTWTPHVLFSGWGWGFFAFPAVHYCSNSGQYVMLTSGNAIGAPAGANAILPWLGATPLGPFTWQEQDQINCAYGVYMCDASYFEDTDGSAYAICSSFDNASRPVPNNWVRILPLNSNYTGLAGNAPTHTFKTWADNGMHREAPWILKRGATYYVFTSRTAGWYGSATTSTWATNLAGPWGPPAKDNPYAVRSVPYSKTSWNTQHWCDFANVGSGVTTYVYMGDRWTKFLPGRGNQGWYPLVFDGNGYPSMYGYTNWSIDVNGGGWWSSANNGGIVADGTYQIVNAASQLVVDAANQGTANGTPIDQWQSTNGPGQTWYLFHLGSNQYQIQGAQNGRVFSPVGNSISAGAKLALSDWITNAPQEWTVVPQSQGYYSLVNVKSGLALNVANGSTTNAALLEQQVNDGRASELWWFKKPL